MTAIQFPPEWSALKRLQFTAWVEKELEREAQGIEAATAAETVELGSVHESPVGGNADAPKED